jgi:acyl-CoA synthetase (AMP-forming)/AMP-acid ligase II
METVRDVISKGATEHPDKLFLTIAEGGRQLSWAQLEARCGEIGTLLDQKNIAPGATVSFLLDNGYWSTLLLLGVMYSGRVVLALNALSGKESLSYVINHSDAKLLFINDAYQQQYSGVISSLDAPLPIIETDEELGPSLSLSVQIKQNSPEITAQDIALLMYTSGTTGRPKGVLLSHKSVLAGGCNTADAHQLSNRDIGMCVLPLYHINAQMVSVMGALVSYSQLVMARKFSARQFWHAMARYNCTWFSIVPTIISYLIEHDAQGVDEPTMQKIRQNVRFGRSASAALSPAKHQQFEQRFGIHIIETMGLTETAAQILSNPMPPEEIKYGSPGIAVGNEARIIDEAGGESESGVIGELMIRGDNVMNGYYKNEAATKETLEPDGWLHTGDLAYRDEEGFFFITGRLKELIIKGGENIAPREIDDILYRHPAVLEAAAFGVEDEHYGQEIMACVALCPGMQATEKELLELCVENLGQYKAPKRVLIRDTLPKGPSGKIQRLKLSA